jgi:hypothetical protein
MRSAFDMKHVKSVTAWALLYQGKEAGKIVANWSDNRYGSVCTATVVIHDGPLNPPDGYGYRGTGAAGGGGYCKFSTAVSQAVNKRETASWFEKVQKFTMPDNNFAGVGETVGTFRKCHVRMGNVGIRMGR